MAGSIFSPEEFEKEFGGVEQPAVSADEDLRGRLGGMFLKTLVSPIRAVGEIGKIDTLRNMGETIEGGIDNAFPSDPGSYPGMSGDIASGIGSMAGFMVPGAVIGAGPKTAAGIATGFGMASQGTSQLDEARQMGATEEQQRNALLQGTALGSFEGVPIGRVFGRVAPAAHEIADSVSGFLLKVAKEGAKGAAEEAAQEGLTQLGSNIIASDLAGYDPDRAATEDVAYNALLGALLGGPVSGAAATMGQEQGRTQQASQPQALQGDILPPESMQPSGAPQVGITPMTIDGQVIQPEAQPQAQPEPQAQPQPAPQPEPQPQETAANSANSMRNLDLSKPLDGEVEIQIDDGEGNTVPGYWHEPTNRVREKGQKPADSVLAAQPKAQAQPEQTFDTVATQPEQQPNNVAAQLQQKPNSDATQSQQSVASAETQATPENPFFAPPNQQAQLPAPEPSRAEQNAINGQRVPPKRNQALIDAIQGTENAGNQAETPAPTPEPTSASEPVAGDADLNRIETGGEIGTRKRYPGFVLKRNDSGGISIYKEDGSHVGASKTVAGVARLMSQYRNPYNNEPFPDYGDFTSQPEATASQPEAIPENVPAQPEAARPELKPRTPIVARPVERATAETMRGTKVDVEYAVVEAGDLIASNTDDGGINPSYPKEMQPRDRDRAASVTQISDIASDLKPEWLDKSPKAADGAPIISPDGVVESGNGRTLAMRRAYAQGKAGAYRDYLASKGYPVDGMKQPVLVRVRKTDMDPASRQRFAAEANERDNLSMSATEQAMADSKALPDSALDLWRGGDVDAAQNRDFVRSFIQSAVGKNEQAEVIAGDGSISQAAIRRIQGALLAKAYGDADLVGAMVESAENDIRAIGGALLDVSAVWAKMRVAAKEQRINPDADTTDRLIEAVRTVQRARRENTKLSLLVGQRDIFSGTTIDPVAEAYLKLMFRDISNWTKPVGREKLAEVLGYHVDQAMKTTPGVDLLGQAPVSPDQALAQARAKLEKLYTDGTGTQTQDLFAAGNAVAGKNDGAPSQDGAGQGPVSQEDGGSQASERTSAVDGSKVEKPVDGDDAGDAFDAAIESARKDQPANDDAGDAFDAAVSAEFGVQPAPQKAKPDNSILKPLAPGKTDGPMTLDNVFEGISAILREDNKSFTDPVYEKLLPYLRAGMALSPGETNRERMASLVGFLRSKGMTVEQITKLKPYAVRFADDLKAGKESLNVSGGTGNLEPDSGNRAAGDKVGSADLPASEGRNDAGARARGNENNEEGGDRGTGSGVSKDNAADDRGGSDLTVPDPEPESDLFNTPDSEPIGGRDAGQQGPVVDPTPAKTVVGTSATSRDVTERRAAQKAAESIPIKPGLENIRATLPMLHPEQQNDVAQIEDRFDVADGILVTHGTGTGKTFVGLGAIKRMARKGKGNILIVAPRAPILDAWIKAGKLFGLDISMLADKKDAGKGIVATTYSNLGDNKAIANRTFDMVVTDEAHFLSSNVDGNPTDALLKLRAITGHPDGFETKARSVFAKEYEAVEKAPDDQKSEKYAAYRAKADPAIAKWKTQPRGKSLMLSATPFAHHFSLDYAEGYLFDFPKSENKGGYNTAEGRNKFYVENLGYRMRYNKLTKPDASVQTDILERDLHEKLKKSGAVIGRTLEVEHDYDRKFVLTENKLGKQIDDVFKWLTSEGDGRYFPLYDRYQKKFDYLSRARLLEAMKARSALPLIRKNIELGRKVMVFHNYNVGGGFNPFEDLSKSGDQVQISVGGKLTAVKISDLYDEFIKANPHVPKLNFSGYLAPIDAMKNEFGNSAVFFNGTVAKKARPKALEKWNEKGSGVDVIVIQADAGEMGISGHDTAGDAPRILYNLGLPVRPTAAIQQEGRIYRDGQKSDAMFRYLNTGTTWERMAFATTIAQRAGTAENLAMGAQARALKQAFIDAYMDSDTWEPGHQGEGKGGKESDRAMTQQMTPYERAKTYYYSQQKRTARNKSSEGVDYFATPEPLGVKMVEWANIKPGESVLEPSAGHGAIARWFPEGTNVTIVEPSAELISKAMVNVGSDVRAVHNRFENFNIVNKFDAIVMNPPFGSGGKTAVEHLDKATKHLKNGGRIVALLPTGPAADKRFDAWYEGVKGISIVRDAKLPAVTFNRAGTSVMTRIVVLEKQIDKDVNAPDGGRRDYTDSQTIDTLFDRIEHSEVPPRAEPKTIEEDIPREGMWMVHGSKFELFPAKQSQPDGDQFVKPVSFLGKPLFMHLKNIAEQNNGNYEGARGKNSGFRFNSIENRDAFLAAYKAKPEADPEAETAEEAATPVSFNVANAFNRVRGKNQYVATLKGKVGRERYLQVLAVAKENGGYYSSFKGPGAVPGFQFNIPEDRQKFIDHYAGEEQKSAPSNVSKKTRFEDRSAGFRPTNEFEAPKGSDLGKAARDFVLKKGRELGNKLEALLVLDDNGNVISEGHGANPSHVGFSPEFENLIEDDSNKFVIHHNHPSGKSFSTQDLIMMAYKPIQVVYAHSEKHYFRATLSNNVTQILDGVDFKERAKILNRVFETAAKGVTSQIQSLINSKHIKGEEFDLAVAEVGHIIAHIHHNAGMIDYKTDFESKLMDNPYIQEVVAESIDRVEAMVAKFARDLSDAQNYRNDRSTFPDRVAGDMAEIFEPTRNDSGRRDGTEAKADEAGEANGFQENERGLNKPTFYSEVLRDAALEGALFEDDISFTEPANNNWTVPKRGTFEVLFKGNGTLMKRLRHAKSKEAIGASIDNWRVKFQDRFLPMLRVEQAIEEHKGEPLPEEMKVYVAEELYTGRVGSRLDRIQRRYMEPIASIMRNHNLSQEDVGEYLYARHAKERNARIAEINPKMPDGGSGMTNADAAAKLAEFEAQDEHGALKLVGKMVDRMMRESVRFRVEAGLLSQQSADMWQKYQHYVPLRGWEEVDEGSEPGMPNTGKGFTAQGKESRRALGRTSKAGDILATAYSVAHEAIIRGEKNRVVQRLYDLAKAHPNKGYWEINPVRTIRVFNRATGMVTERPESPIFAKDANRTVSAKFKGVEHRIVIHDPELAEAIKRMNAEDLNGMLKFLIGFNRFLSTMNTSYNPEFLISNALRDVQTASVVMATKDTPGLAKAVLKDYRVALAGSWGGLRGKPLSTEWRKWFNEYDRAGGKIAFYKMEMIEDLRKQVDSAARQMSAKDYRTVWRGMKAVGQFIEDMNLAVDNALRLSLYKNLRERGFTKDQAASAAKNLTVNFNRRGQYGVTMNALYLFANAGIQGSAVVINSLKHRRAQQMVGAMVAGSFALTLANIMLMGLDDENGESEYSKLIQEKEWELQRNIVLMLPGRNEDGGQNYAKFPLPYGYNLFHTIGRKMAEVAMGMEDGAGALKDTAVTFVDAFNPIGGTDSILKLISPTIIDPFVEMVENKDFAGRKIRPEREKYDKNLPRSQDYYGSVSPISRHLAAMLNEWTGGNEFKPGALDLSPEWIDHYAKFIGGAASATLWRPINTTTKLARGEDITTNDVPFLRRVHGSTGNYVDRSLFYNRVDEIQAAHAQTDGFRKNGDRESYEALDKRTKLLGAMYSKGFRDMMKRMKTIRQARNDIYAMPLAADERSARLKKLEEAEAAVVRGFNRSYLKAIARSRE